MSLQQSLEEGGHLIRWNWSDKLLSAAVQVLGIKSWNREKRHKFSSYLHRHTIAHTQAYKVHAC